MKKTLAILLSLALVICMIPATASVAFADPVPWTEVEVKLSQESFVYNGTAQEPDVTVTLNNNPLTKGTDYTVTYDNNTNVTTENNKATVKVTGARTYVGKEVTKEFEIKALDLSKDALITVSPDRVDYKGSAYSPEITVKVGNVTLTKDTHYKVEWDKTGYTDADTYTATVSKANSNANVTGNKEVPFVIDKYDLSKVAVMFDEVTGSPSTYSDIKAGAKYYIGGSLVTNTTLKTFLAGSINGTVSRVGTTNEYNVAFSLADDKDAKNYSGLPASTSFKVVTDISTATIRDNDDTKDLETVDCGEYNGVDKKLQDYFKLYVGDTKLVYGTDYIIKCSDTKNATDATRKMTVEGIGKYGKTKEINFKITPRDASAYVSIDNIGTQAESSLSKVEPVVRDKYLGVLTKGVDYVVDPVTSGEVIVRFTKNYTGVLRKTFTVVKNDYDIGYGTTCSKVISSSFMFDDKVHSIGSVDLYKGSTYIDSKYYTVKYEYLDDKNVKQSTTAPRDAREYTVYLEGNSPYAGRKDIGKYTITPFTFNDSYVKINVSQSSTSITPSVVVQSYWGDITFKKGTDYTVSTPNIYSNGTAYITITSTGKGNLASGSKTVSYKINGKSITYCSAEFAPGSKQSNRYTGSAIKPQVKVRDGYTTLTEGTDYTVAYKDAAGKVVYSPIEAGTYTIVIEGKGAYSGTKTMTFEIVGTDISGYTVTLKEASVNATGYSQTPVISSVKKGYYYSLSSNDYAVSYQDATGKTVYSMSAPGTYKVVVTGKNGYSGSTYATFRIVGTPQTVTVNQDSYKVYPTSDPFKITAKATGDGTGFTYTSSNPAVASVSSTGYVTMHKVGRAVITVTTTGMKKYDPASKTVEVKVYPKKTVQAKKPWTAGKKAQLKVRWNYQDGATKYQIRYSRDKNFKAGTYLTKTVNAHGKDYTTQSTTLTKLKRGYTYYVKVRAVYTDPVTGDNYYGSWSGWRSAKTI